MVRGGKTYRIVTDQLGSPRAVVDVATGAVVAGDRLRRVRPRHARHQPGLPAVRLRRRPLRPRHRARALRRARLRPRDGPLHGARTRCASAAASTNLYGYALADPVNLTDPSGQILDTILDIGFIAYDLYRIGKSLMNGCGVLRADVAALGADVAGALIPFATGGGAAARRREQPRASTRSMTQGRLRTSASPATSTGGCEHVRDGKITQEAADAAQRTEVTGRQDRARGRRAAADQRPDQRRRRILGPGAQQGESDRAEAPTPDGRLTDSARSTACPPSSCSRAGGATSTPT